MRPALSSVVFTHIPKTGGSTVSASLFQNLSDDEYILVTRDEDQAVDEVLAGRAPTSADLRFIAGHVRCAKARATFPDPILIAAVRDPVERVLSHYFFILREDPHCRATFQNDPRNEGFIKFYETVITALRLRNLQCRFLGGSEDHRAALSAVREHYHIVWDTAAVELAFPYLTSVLDGEQEGGRVVARPALARASANELILHYVAPVAGTDEELKEGKRPASYKNFLSPQALEMLLDGEREDILFYQGFRSMTHDVFINRKRVKVVSP